MLDSEERILMQQAMDRFRAAEKEMIFWRHVADCLARHDPDAEQRSALRERADG